jgi:hypothetical protein
MIRHEAKDIKTLWDHAYFGIINDEPGVVDHFARNIFHSFGNVLTAQECFFDFDLGDIGLTPTKWTKFTGQYVDVESLHAWINNAMNVKTYDSLWQFKDIPPNFGGRKAVHQWGKCLLAFSFRRKPKPTLTLYTRAQSVGFSGVADYALAHFVAKKLAQRMGIDQRKIRLEVHCANLMVKAVEVIVFLKGRGLLEEYMEKQGRIPTSIRYYHDYLHRPDEKLKWRAANRWRTKLRRVEAEDHRPLIVDKLTLKGWELNNRTAPTLTHRATQELVLVGKRGPDTIIVPGIGEEG